MNAESFFRELMDMDSMIVAARDRGDGTYAAIKPLIFHWTMMIGDIGDLQNINDRYCYGDELLAATGLEEWERRGWEGEPKGWHRHLGSGRRRPDGDADREYIEF